MSTNEPKPSQRSEECSVIRRDRATPTVFNYTGEKNGRIHMQVTTQEEVGKEKREEQRMTMMKKHRTSR